MADKCCRCGGKPEKRIYIGMSGMDRNIEKDVCDECAETLEYRIRDWCGDFREENKPSWLKQGWNP